MHLLTKTLLSMGILASPAWAGGIDRSGQGIGYMFETGNYAELSFGTVAPKVQATGDAYGNIANRYSSLTTAFKTDVSDKLSLGMGMDSPYGADTSYDAMGLAAKVNSSAITALARYRLSPNFSVHGGASRVTLGGSFDPAPPTPAGVVVDIANSSATGYVIGAAYEKPEIAARVAVTYFSGTDHADAASASSFNAPSALNLDFQTGIAANTLLFGGARFVQWNGSKITVAGTDVVTYTDDTISYSLGLGRKFTDAWSGAVSLGYEAPLGGVASALSPTDGTKSIGLGATYTKENMKITAGLRYVALGDATTSGLPVNDWSGNSALAVGLKIGFTF